ncbi:MAG: SLC13 family permease [Myxococcaceae bacterium]
MTIAIALGMVVLAVLLLSSDRIPIEISSLTIVVALVLTGLVTAEEALAGFSNDSAIFIFALLALTQGLAATGVMQIAGRRLLYFTRFGTPVFVLVLLAVVCAFSSMASNTAVTAAFLPVVMSVAIQSRVRPERLLMPVAFSSMLGGTIFLFGTSTNLVTSAAMEQAGLAPIGFAELTPVGLPLAGIGIVVTLLLVKWLLPTRSSPHEAARSGQRAYVTEAVLAKGSRLEGKDLRQLTEERGIPVRGIVRDGRLLPPDADETLHSADHILISGTREDILRVKDLRSVALRADLVFAETDRAPHGLLEVSIPPTSRLEGRSLLDVRFPERFGVAVLAIHRHPSIEAVNPRLDLMNLVYEKPLDTVPLAVGDLLLVSGPDEQLQALARDNDFTVLGEVGYQRPRYRRAALAIAIFAGVVLVAGSRTLSPAIAGLTGLLAMVATGCVDASTAFRVDWRVPIMIGSLLTLGLAMEKSGAGAFLAQGIAPLASSVGPRGVLAALMLGTIVLSVPMSNQAAALVMLPVGLHVAEELGVGPRTFAIGVCLAASCSFLTPLEPSAALVYGPGRYRFTDFLRVGAPLSLLMLVLLTLLVPLFWPLRHA